MKSKALRKTKEKKRKTFLEKFWKLEAPSENLKELIKRNSPQHFTLIDTDKYKINLENFIKIQNLVKKVCEYGTDAILIGGSTGTIEQVAFCKMAVKPIALVYNKPVVLFPHNADDIVGFCDIEIQTKVLKKIQKEAHRKKQKYFLGEEEN